MSACKVHVGSIEESLLISGRLRVHSFQLLGDLK